jgi:hypothetical protein
MRNAFAIVLTAVSLAGCGTASPSTTTSTAPATTAPPTTTPAGPAPVAVIRESGGCMQMGANCSTIVVWSDGTVAIHRAGVGNETGVPQDADAEVTGTIPIEVIDRLSAAIEATDFAELRSTLGAGSCQGCVDGIDTELTLFGPTGQESLDSIDLAFDMSDPLFVAVDDARQTIALQLSLPIVRG